MVIQLSSHLNIATGRDGAISSRWWCRRSRFLFWHHGPKVRLQAFAFQNPECPGLGRRCFVRTGGSQDPDRGVVYIELLVLL